VEHIIVKLSETIL